MSTPGMVIVGAGHSGARAAAALRKHGWDGSITLIGNESSAPYDRPPLSKAVLLGKKSTAQCAFYSDAWYAENRIDLVLQRKALRIERGSRRVVLDDGGAVPYRRLLLATGARANLLSVPGSDLPGVDCLRTPQHADRIAPRLRPGHRLVVIGAGFIGLEVAAAAVELGCKVVVLEAAPRALARSLPENVSSAMVQVHRDRGVDIRFCVSVARVEGDSHVTSVVLGDGQRLPCDSVVFGIGVRPHAELAEEAGLEVLNGIVVDQRLQTSDEDIFACGDACSFHSVLYRQSLRLESWKNAEDQADTAALNMLGQGSVYDEVPWFWSNQYNLALQVAGLPALGAATIERWSGSAYFFFSLDAGGHLVGVSGFGPMRDVAPFMRTAKTLVARRVVLDAGTLSDERIPIEQLPWQIATAGHG